MAGQLSSATRERIRAASDIVDVIGGYLPLKRAGANFTALCPFHKEKSPSFNVNPQRQIFHCFGCHKGGDVFTFVQEYENIGFMDALRRLADRAKITLEFDNSPGDLASRHLKDQLLEIHDKIAQRWQNVLAGEAAGQTARDYLNKRGVSPDAIKLFRLGAAPDAWDDTVNWATGKAYPLDLVEKAGLIIRKEETGKYYDRFRGRLMFPICDESGRVVGFSGRILSGDEKIAKYVNSPETAIFTKSKIFYGLDKSKRAILDAGYAIVCEGQLDLIACFSNGVPNVLAPQGTAFTEQHARILKRYANEAVLCFDSDNAGQNAIVRSLDHLLTAGLAVRVAVIPAPHDPDSFIKEFGGDQFLELIKNGRGFFDYYLERLCATNELSSDKGRLAVLRGMAESVHKTGNNVLVDTYAQKTALRLGVSATSVRAEFAKFRNPGPNSPATDDDEVVPAEEEEMAARPPVHEFHLLKLLMVHEELAAQAGSLLSPDWIQHPLVRQIVSGRLAVQQSASWQGLAAFLDEYESSAIRSLITEAATEERKIPNPELQLTDLILKLRNQFFDRQIATLTQKMSQPGIPDEEKINHMREHQKLREQRRTPLSPL
jgi:DNA primase